MQVCASLGALCYTCHSSIHTPAPLSANAQWSQHELCRSPCILYGGCQLYLAVGPCWGAGGGGGSCSGKCHREEEEGCLELGHWAWPETAPRDTLAKHPRCISRVQSLLLSTNQHYLSLKYLLKVGRIDTVICLEEKKCCELEQRCLRDWSTLHWLALLPS